MPFVNMNLLAQGHSGYGRLQLVLGTEYNPKTNVTKVKLVDCLISSGSILGNLENVNVTIKISATDKPENFESAHISARNVGSTSLSRPPYPAVVSVQHGYEETKKSISVHVYANVTINRNNKNIIASGSSDNNFVTGTASIVHVGENRGTLFIYDNGEWRVGYLHAADGQKWNFGVGYVILDTDGLSVSYDDNGNVTLSGLPVSHDGEGNVVFNSGSATEDGNGNVTLI